MRRVSAVVRRAAAIVLFAAVLFGPAALASADDVRDPRDPIVIFIVWLESRFSVPGG
jgi:hypothetical protein